MMRLKHISLFFVLFISGSMLGQQEWGYSLNMFNIYDLNSAYAGAYKEINLAGRYRYQWTGIEGAPSSEMISGHFPIFQNVGGGVKLFHESIGARNRFSAKGTVSYKLPLRTGFLGFAFNGGLIAQNLDQNQLKSKTDLSDILGEEYNNGSAVSVDFSLLWYTNQHFVGLEIQNLNEPSFYPGNFTDFNQVRHYILTGAYAIELNEDLIIRPTALVKSIGFNSFTPEAHLSAFFSKKFWLGMGYRLNGSVLAMAELNINDNIRFGYSYDRGIGDLGVFATSSHEIFFGYRIKTESTKGTSIRYFK